MNWNTANWYNGEIRSTRKNDIPSTRPKWSSATASLREAKYTKIILIKSRARFGFHNLLGTTNRMCRSKSFTFAMVCLTSLLQAKNQWWKVIIKRAAVKWSTKMRTNFPSFVRKPKALVEQISKTNVLIRKWERNSKFSSKGNIPKKRGIFNNELSFSIVSCSIFIFG